MQKNAIFFVKDLVVSSKSSTFAPAFEKVRAFSSVRGAMKTFRRYDSEKLSTTLVR